MHKGFLIYARQCPEFTASASVCILLQFLVGALVVYFAIFLLFIICTPLVLAFCACIKHIAEQVRVKRESNGQPNAILVQPATTPQAFVPTALPASS